MDTREQLRIRESAKLAHGARELDQRIAEADAAVNAAEAQQASAEEVESLTLDAENVRSEKELFLWQHDTTGAWKAERFGKDLRTMYEDLGFERAPEGAQFRSEAASRTHLLLVNMGELDRLNESGDHDLGDKALDLTFARMQEAVRSALIEQDRTLAKDETSLVSKYDIYRTAGNDFSLVLRDASEETAEQVRRAMSGSLDVSGLKAGQEPAPLSAMRVNVGDAARMMEAIRPVPDHEDGAEATLFIAALREKLLTLSDFDKIRSRVERMATKIRTGGEGMSAEELYGKYLKKTLGTLFAEPDAPAMEFDAFTQELDERGAFEEDGFQWNKKLFNLSSDEALRMFKTRTALVRRNSQVILESVLSDLRSQGGALAEELGEGPPPSSERRLAEVSEDAIAAFEKRIDHLGESTGERRLRELELAVVEDRGEGRSLKRNNGKPSSLWRSNEVNAMH